MNRILSRRLVLVVCLSLYFSSQWLLPTTGRSEERLSNQISVAEARYLEEATPYLDFIRDRLWREISKGVLAGTRALAETENPLEGDLWFWTDDNAKALEAFLVPSAYSKYEEVAQSLIDFVRTMSDGAIIKRRLAEPVLTITADDPENYEINTSLLTYQGDLLRGEVLVSYRFHDGRDALAAKFSGNWIQFSYADENYQFDIEDTIVSAQINKDNGNVQLQHVSDFKLSGTEPVARATYTYTIDPAKTELLISIAVEALNGANLKNVKVTSAMDQLSGLSGSIAYHRFCSTQASRASCVSPPVSRTQLSADQITGYSLLQSGIPGFSYSIHSKVLSQKNLVEIVSEGAQDNKFHWVYAVYSIGDIDGNEEKIVQEAKGLAAGASIRSVHEDGKESQKGHVASGLDPSMSYDYGSELNALGCYYMFAKTGRYEPYVSVRSPQLVELKQWFDRHLQAFQSDFLVAQEGSNPEFPFVFARGLAFVMLGVDCMYRATGETHYNDTLARMVDVALSLQRQSGREEDQGLFRCIGQDSHLDCQAAVILALARLSLTLDDPRVQEAIINGLNAIDIRSWNTVEGEPELVSRGDSTISISIGPHRPNARDGMRWGYKAGLMLRALHAVEAASQAGKINLDANTRWRLATLKAAATDYIHASTVPRGNTLELLTSYSSSETNSESQPWMLLGLFPIDPLITEIKPPTDLAAEN